MRTRRTILVTKTARYVKPNIGSPSKFFTVTAHSISADHLSVMSGVAVPRHLYVSPGHNFFGHHGREPGHHRVIELTEVRCLAGRGMEGDRFLDHKDNYKGQVTLFSYEVYDSLCHQFGIWNKPPSVFRRNVITSGVDLNEWIGKEFEIQGVRFAGVEECKPCYWMDQAFGCGAEEAMRGRGGLRARVLTDGVLRLPVLKESSGIQSGSRGAIQS